MAEVKKSGVAIDLRSNLETSNQPKPQNKYGLPDDPFAATAPLIDIDKLLQAGATLLQQTPTGLALTTAVRWFQKNSKKEEKDSTQLELELQKQLGQVAVLVQEKKFSEAERTLGQINQKFFLDDKSEKHLSAKNSKNYSAWLVKANLLRAEIYTGLGKKDRALEVYQKVYVYLDTIKKLNR